MDNVPIPGKLKDDLWKLVFRIVLFGPAWLLDRSGRTRPIANYLRSYYGPETPAKQLAVAEEHLAVGTRQIEELIRLRVAAETTTAPPDSGSAYWIGRPEAIGEGLVGREEEMEALAGLCQAHRVVIVSGGAGVGKSRLVAEHTHATGAPGFWTPADHDVTLTLYGLAGHIGVNHRGQARARSSRRGEPKAGSHARTHGVGGGQPPRCGPSQRAGSPRKSRTPADHVQGCHGEGVPASIGFLPLEVLEPDPAVRLLCSRSGGRVSPTDNDLEEIAEEVGRLPLALEMLAVRLGERKTPAQVLDEIRAAPTPIQLTKFREAAGTSVHREQGVFATIVGTLEALPPDVREWMSPLGYLADQPVSMPLFRALTGLDEDQREDRLIAECRRLSVLDRVGDGLRLHSLTMAAICATNGDSALRETLSKAQSIIADLGDRLPSALSPQMAHHEQILTRAMSILGREDQPTLDFSDHLAAGLLNLGRYDQAIPLFRDILEARERVLGEEHPDTLGSRNNLAVAYWNAGRHQEGIALHEKALEMMERVLGEEHPDTLSSRNNLAITYGAAGRHQERIALHEKTLEVMERVLGEEHPDTLASRNNLAVAYGAAGRHQERIALDVKTLEAKERLLGEEHPDTLASRNNLAVAYGAAGRHQEEIALIEKALEARERLLGEEHPDTLGSRNNLAAAYHEARRYQEAIALHEKTLEARERLLGEEHPDTLSSRNNLAAAYHEARRYQEAIALHEKTLEARVRVLGEEHPSTLNSRNHLAEAYEAVGRHKDAEGVLRGEDRAGRSGE